MNFGVASKKVSQVLRRCYRSCKYNEIQDAKGSYIGDCFDTCVLVSGNYGLISSNENMRSSVSAEEVEAFWKMEDQMEASVPKQEANDDMEDLVSIM